MLNNSAMVYPIGFLYGLTRGHKSPALSAQRGMSWEDRKWALVEDSSGHTTAWALKASLQSLEKDEVSKSDGRVELGAMDGNET